MIRVYHFKVWDQSRKGYVVPPYKSPAALISHIRGVILTESAESVELSSLDSEQRFDPRSRRPKLFD